MAEHKVVQHKIVTTDAEIDRAIEQARNLQDEPRVTEVEYRPGPGLDLLILKLSDGRRHLIPREDLQGLQSATREQIARVEILGNGTGLHWPALNLDHYFPSLLRRVYGTKSWMAKIGRSGGSAKSAAKRKAARANGLKGGRPRRKELAASMMTEVRCVWCHDAVRTLTDDHVFPRCLGGTKDLKLSACVKCQETISKAEAEFSRRSLFALYCVDSGPAGRNKRRPTSGTVRADYILNRHPLGGYGETVLKAGGGIRGLAYIEIDVNSATPRGNTRGASPDDVEQLVSTYRSMLRNTPEPSGLVCEMDVRTHDLGEIGADPRFWPRIVLDLNGKLFIRARNPDEALKFIRIFTRMFSCYIRANTPIG